MGRISLSIRKALILSALSLPVFAAEVDGVKLKDKMNCGGVELPLVAAGLRDATIFNIRVYVLAMYAPAQVTSLTDPNVEKRPMCFEVHYLRDVEKAKVDEAWEYQFKESSEYEYPKLKDDIKLLQNFFGEIKKEKGIHLFELLENSTKVYETGVYKGEIPGKEFGKNFISVFYGKNPPTKKLREALMKGKK
jgi:hypothetical protein